MLFLKAGCPFKGWWSHSRVYLTRMIRRRFNVMGLLSTFWALFSFDWISSTWVFVTLAYVAHRQYISLTVLDLTQQANTVGLQNLMWAADPRQLLFFNKTNYHKRTRRANLLFRLLYFVYIKSQSLSSRISLCLDFQYSSHVFKQKKIIYSSHV